MDERQLDLGKDLKELAPLSGISEVTIRKARNRHDEPITTATARGIELAWRWAEGSVKKILAGGDPTELDAITRMNIPEGGGTGLAIDELTELSERLKNDRPLYWHISGLFARIYENGRADGWRAAKADSGNREAG